MYECKNFEMYTMSFSQLFGKTPKIKFICGNCEMYDSGRLDVEAVKWGKPFIRCSHCGAENYIPIKYRNED